MTVTHVSLLLILVGLVIWWGRRIPVAGWRRLAAITARAIALAALALALWGPSRTATQEVPRHILYLLDGSASIDPAQRAWMARRIASLEARRPPSVQRAVAVFGAEAQLLVPFGRGPLTDAEMLAHRLEGLELPREQTNLESALLAALGWLPPRQRSAVVLLSDGRETVGSAGGILAYARRLGLAVFPETPPLTEQAHTVWEELAAAPSVQRGSPLGLQLIVFNGGSQAKVARVTASVKDIALKRQRVAIRPGWHVVTLSVPTVARGTLAVDVRLELPDEGIDESRRVYTEVEGPPQALLVTDGPTALPALGAALKRRGMDVALIRPQDLPTARHRLLDADAVLLFNTPRSALTAEQVAALEDYVRADGGGLLTVGLGGDLTEELQTPSPLDALLPVRFEPKGLQEAKRRVCMIMLIDRSASMLGPRIAATKRAAVELVKQLSPDDLVGVLAFDTKPYVVAEVQPASQVGAWLVEKLVQLKSSGGTDVYPALAAAENRLDLTGATLKHIILLSDGNTPFHAEAYDALVKGFGLSGTTVSTIGIGAAFINTDYLKWLAESTGGTFYQLRSLEELPRLITRDTQSELGRLPFAEGFFRPVKEPMSDWFTDVDVWPAVRGFLTATAKPEARVDLTINGGEEESPLLARWFVGRGRVVSFTSDADTRWSPEWIRWPGFEAAWAQVVRWAMRPRLSEELFVWTDASRGTPQLMLEANLHDPQGILVAADGTQQMPLALVQTGSSRWQAALEDVPSGWYQLLLESQVGEAAPGPQPPESRGAIVARRWMRIGTPAVSQESTGQPPREAFLRQMAMSTGGAYDAADRALLPPTTRATTTEPLVAWWVGLALLALLVDVAARGGSMV